MVAERHRCKGVDGDEAVKNYLKAVDKGVLKVMSKMGISTLQSYRGAQIFEAIGLNREVDRPYFTGTRVAHRGRRPRRASRARAQLRHDHAYKVSPDARRRPRVGRPVPVAAARRVPHVQPGHRSRSCSTRCAPAATRCSRSTPRSSNDESRRLCTLRGLLQFKPGTPIPLDEVEPATRDRQALRDRRHVARLDQPRGAREPRHRDEPHRRQVEHRRGRRGPGALRARRQRRLCAAARSSRWRRAASASPATTWSTPTSCRSRWRRAPSPARAASSPATRSTSTSRKIRYSTPGVGLISPPPHHDIYSIEDLAQLIHDLKNSNNRARISVKLVAEVGVGTVAAGVAKAQGRRRPDQRRRRRHRRLAAHVDQARRHPVGARPRRDAAGAGR